MKIFALSPLGVTVKGDDLLPLLRIVVDEHPHGSYTVYGILHNFTTGAWTCWTMGDNEDDIQVVSATYTYKDMLGRDVCRIVFIAGNMRGEYVSLMEQFKRVCEEAGIARIEIVSRKGFARVLAEAGFENQYVVLRCDLNNPRTPEFSMAPNIDQIGRA